MKLNDLTGQKFGRLTVIGRAPNDRKGRAMWWCECNCGNIKAKPVQGYDLISGRVRSCGCLYFESNKGRNATHSMSQSRIYREWVSMKGRCSRHKRYISKGITVCPEWSSFEVFYDWAMSSGYSDDLTLDRSDNDGNYCPDNCRWVTMKEQQNNRRNNRIVVYNDTPFTVATLADFLGIPYATLWQRINSGWSQEDWNLAPNLNNKNLRRIKHEFDRNYGQSDLCN